MTYEELENQVNELIAAGKLEEAKKLAAENQTVMDTKGSLNSIIKALNNAEIGGIYTYEEDERFSLYKDAEE